MPGSYPAEPVARRLSAETAAKSPLELAELCRIIFDCADNATRRSFALTSFQIHEAVRGLLWRTFTVTERRVPNYLREARVGDNAFHVLRRPGPRGLKAASEIFSEYAEQFFQILPTNAYEGSPSQRLSNLRGVVFAHLFKPSRMKLVELQMSWPNPTQFEYLIENQRSVSRLVFNSGLDSKDGGSLTTKRDEQLSLFFESLTLHTLVWMDLKWLSLHTLVVPGLGRLWTAWSDNLSVEFPEHFAGISHLALSLNGLYYDMLRNETGRLLETFLRDVAGKCTSLRTVQISCRGSPITPRGAGKGRARRALVGLLADIFRNCQTVRLLTNEQDRVERLTSSANDSFDYRVDPKDVSTLRVKSFRSEGSGKQLWHAAFEDVPICKSYWQKEDMETTK
jgi:hypothetical protein